MKRWLKWFLGAAVLVLGIWYFLLKDYHYQVSFTSSQPPGILFHHILDWDNYKLDNKEITLVSKNKYSEVIQRVRSGDSSFLYRWQIAKNYNNETELTAFITDEKNGFAQKLKVPFGNNDFLKESIKNVRSVAEAFKLNSEYYDVHSITDTVFQPTYCAYLTMESTVNKKATTMSRGIAVIMEYIKNNDIPLNGDPFLEVTEWNEENETIRFNFCFPIKQLDSMPFHPSVQFKTTKELKGIKAEFNGNYRISDNAWYYLIEHAEKNNMAVKRLPFELYLNDPHAGGDPLQWKAHILLPLKE
jgi:effector-binding domain-containing protein